MEYTFSGSKNYSEILLLVVPPTYNHKSRSHYPRIALTSCTYEVLRANNAFYNGCTYEVLLPIINSAI